MSEDAHTGEDTDPAVADGGAKRADDVALDPWGSSSVADYRKLFEDFGIEEFDEVLPGVSSPHYLMRRGVIFGHRDYERVAEAMRTGDPFAALSGFMPTGDPHIGHKLVFDELIWHQQQGGDVYPLIADLEAHSARGMTWQEIDTHARDYLLSLLALGFDPDEGDATVYRQSERREVQDLGFELGSEANFSEMEALYGFGGETNISHLQSVITQMADILYPQVDGKPKPTVIPVGPDQDPHVRLARDLAARTRYFGVTEAFASFEVTDREREVLRWAHDSLRATLDSQGIDGSALRCDLTARFLRAFPDPDSEQAAADREPHGSAGAPDTGGILDPELFRDAAGEFTLPDEYGSEPFDDLLAVDSFPPAAAWESSAESLVGKLENAGKEPLRRRIRVLDRNATDEAFTALIEAVDGEKRVFEAHIDSFDLDRQETAELARQVELDHGGFGFQPPSSIYHRFMTGLTGGKMSSSVPASHISLLDDPEEGYDKVMDATTGGRETAAKQRELGGRADECPVYELYAYLLSADDDEFAKRVYDECTSGELLCGDCKQQAAELMKSFLADHQEKRAEAEELLADLEIDLNLDLDSTSR
ncbi:MAG: tryptophanyl-tRNA synthetase [Halorubrum sp. J07HR59]|nr:MAG: tryptophanyl-tRNA synthetase [Halorubrum sp. J07HR59]